MARRRTSTVAASLLQLAPKCLRVRNTAPLGSGGPQPRHLSVCDRRRPRHPRAQKLALSCLAVHSDGGRRAYVDKPVPRADMTKANVAVVGGGLTGLTAAYYLAKILPPTAKITIYEAGDRLGGWVRTDRVDVNVNGTRGTVAFERGPRTLQGIGGMLGRFDDMVLCDLMLDLGLKVKGPPSSGLARYIYYPDRPVQVPPRDIQGYMEPLFLEAIPSVLSIFWKTALRRYGMASLTMPEEDLSVSEWLRDLSGGREGWDSMASAMLNGIHGGDIDKLSAASVFDAMWRSQYLLAPEKGKFWVHPFDRALWDIMSADGAVLKRRREKSPPVIHFGEKGMEGLTKALADALKDQSNVTIKLKEPVKQITRDKGTGKVEIRGPNAQRLPLAYDKVIATVGAQTLAGMTGNKLPTLAEITAVSMMVVSVWYPDPNINKYPGLGYLIPRTIAPELNPECALGVFFDSDVGLRGPNEPAGTKLTVLMGGHYYDSVMQPPSEALAIQQAKAILERHMGIPVDTPCFTSARFAKDCIPQHNVGHSARIAQADFDLQRSFGGRLAVAGGSYTRNGVVPAMRAGFEVGIKCASGYLGDTGLGRPFVPEMEQMSRAEVLGTQADGEAK